jgi:NAD(P)-dependent dehydrogenase (short-subunit alcohol dehydrogenase family)
MSVQSLLPPSNTASSSMLLLVTGASRGFGRAIATVAAQHVSQLRAILVARSADGLQETVEAMKTTRRARTMDPKEEKEEKEAGDDGLAVSCHVMDLSDLDHLEENLNNLLQQTVQLGHDDNDENGGARLTEDASMTRAANSKNYDHIVFINNAGSIGHIGLSWTSPSLQEMRENVDLNVTSSLWTSVRFVRHITSLLDKEQSSLSLTSTTETTATTIPSTSLLTNHSALVPKITLVNVSSLVAIADFPSLGIYSAGKASRDKYHTLMALELTKTAATAAAATTPGSIADNSSSTSLVSVVPRIKVLNYAPGPLETDMVTEIRQAPALDDSLKPHYEKPQLSPEQSAQKIVKLLLSNDFASGSHIDYYDLPDE